MPLLLSSKGDYLHGLRVIGVVPRHCSWRNLVKPDTKFAELKRCSADLLKYSELLQRFEQSDFGNQLGNAFRGLDTDCEQLMLLRDWYKKVRACYGIGFGKRVAIGSGLFNLDGEIIKGVHLIEEIAD